MSTIPPMPFPLRSDSYKLTHWRQYPPGTTEVYSYLESRGGRFPQTVFFGLQPYLRSYLAGSVVTAIASAGSAAICWARRSRSISSAKISG